jgi:hypothetical protein
MQSAMQMFVARFASKDPRILQCHGCFRGSTNTGGEFKHQVQQAKLEGPL